MSADPSLTGFNSTHRSINVVDGVGSQAIGSTRTPGNLRQFESSASIKGSLKSRNMGADGDYQLAMTVDNRRKGAKLESLRLKTLTGRHQQKPSSIFMKPRNTLAPNLNNGSEVDANSIQFEHVPATGRGSN